MAYLNAFIAASGNLTATIPALQFSATEWLIGYTLYYMYRNRTPVVLLANNVELNVYINY